MRPLAILVLVAVAACSGSPRVTVASDSEALALAQSIDAALKRGDPGNSTDYAIDVGIDRASARISTPDWRAVIRRYSAARAARTTLPKALPSAQLRDIKVAGGIAELLHMRRFGDDASALFHFKTARGGLGYFELVIADVDGVARVVDWRNSTTCVLQSDAALASGLAGVDPGERNALKRLGDSVDAVQRLKVFAEHCKAGRSQEALASYDLLSERFKTDKNVLAMRFVAATAVGGAPYLAASRALRDASDDPLCRALLSIDIATDAHDTAGAVASIDAADAAIGGDPFLAALRASLTASGR